MAGQRWTWRLWLGLLVVATVASEVSRAEVPLAVLPPPAIPASPAQVLATTLAAELSTHLGARADDGCTYRLHRVEAPPRGEVLADHLEGALEAALGARGGAACRRVGPHDRPSFDLRVAWAVREEWLSAKAELTRRASTIWEALVEEGAQRVGVAVAEVPLGVGLRALLRAAPDPTEGAAPLPDGASTRLPPLPQAALGGPVLDLAVAIIGPARILFALRAESLSWVELAPSAPRWHSLDLAHLPLPPHRIRSPIGRLVVALDRAGRVGVLVASSERLGLGVLMQGAGGAWRWDPRAWPQAWPLYQSAAGQVVVCGWPSRTDTLGPEVGLLSFELAGGDAVVHAVGAMGSEIHDLRALGQQTAAMGADGMAPGRAVWALSRPGDEVLWWRDGDRGPRRPVTGGDRLALVGGEGIGLVVTGTAPYGAPDTLRVIETAGRRAGRAARGRRVAGSVSAMVALSAPDGGARRDGLVLALWDGRVATLTHVEAAP